jgi:ribosomal-protein-alanine N-acetyltransferase
MASISPPQEPLGDGLITLRLSAERDIPEILIAYQDDRQLHRRLGQARPPSGADLGRACEETDGDLAAGRRVMLTICEAAHDACVGQVAIGQLDWENRRGEAVVWVAPGARRRGYATAALRLAAGWAFARCGLARLTLLVEPDNAAMLATAKDAGAQHEGVLRGHRALRRGRQDMIVLSLLPADLG